MKMIPYARQSIDESDLASVAEALKEDIITRGARVEEFEKAIANLCGASYAVAFNSGTSALMAAYHAAGVNSFDKLITTPNTFVATTGAAIQCGAEPVFIDMDRSTGNIDLDKLGEHLEEAKATRGRTIIAPVHFAGIAVDMRKLQGLILDADAVVIEDAAHALGSSYPSGEKVGSCAWSDMTMFSFHPAKHITTGEGGMITTNSQDYYKLLCRYRDNGIERDQSTQPWYYEVQELTGNFHLTAFQAALGLSQLKRLDQFVEKKRQLMKRYRKRLDGAPNIKLFSPEPDARTAYHLCVSQIDFDAIGKKRGEVMLQLKEQGISTQVHYIPVYKHPFFTKGKLKIDEYFPEMESYYRQALSLPLYYDLAEKDVDRVCEALRAILT